MELYKIGEGVHRSVAAREAGLDRILATIFQDGQPPRVQVVLLDQLYSPKAFIHRFDRNADIMVLVSLLSTPEGRSRMVAIGIEPLSGAGAKRLTPIRSVLLLDGVPNNDSD